MLDKIFAAGLDLLAFVLPISIAVTNIVFFPLLALWFFGARWTFARWKPTWGWPERFFLVFLSVSLVSAALSLDPRHSFREIYKKDFYILIAVLLAAFVRRRELNACLIKIFMAGALLTSIFGLVQYAVGVNVADKADNFFFYLPARLAHWPRPLLNSLAMVNGRVLGTRGHPLAYAECLLFNWAMAIGLLLISRKREAIGWILYLILTGAALLVSQSRGPWIAAAVIAFLAMLTSSSKRGWMIFILCGAFVAVFAAVPVFRDRAVSILDRSHHSNVERVHMWHAGLQMWKSHPWFGIGAGGVKVASSAYQTADEKIWGAWGHLHSVYVNLLAERGALGLLAFLLFISSLVWELRQALRATQKDPWRSAVLQAALLGILGFMIGGLTETVYNTAVVMMTFYFVAGLALALARHESGLIPSDAHDPKE